MRPAAGRTDHLTAIYSIAGRLGWELRGAGQVHARTAPAVCCMGSWQLLVRVQYITRTRTTGACTSMRLVEGTYPS